MSIRGRLQYVACALAALVALTLGAPHDLAWAASEEGDGARDGVVYLEGGVSIGEAWVTYGTATAFFIGEEGKNPQYLITDATLMDTYERYGSGTTLSLDKDGKAITGGSMLRVYYDDVAYDEAYFVDESKSSGLVLLRLDRPTDKRSALPLYVVDDASALTEVKVIGFRGYLDSGYDEGTSIKKNTDASITQGVVSSLTTDEVTGVKMLRSDTTVSEGNTGGPVVDLDGDVVGVNTWEDFGSGKENYAICATEVVDFLKANKVDYETVTKKASTSSDEDEKDEEETDEEGTDETDGEETEETDEDSSAEDETTSEEDTTSASESGISWMLVAAIACAVIALIALVAFIVWRLRSKK